YRLQNLVSGTWRFEFHSPSRLIVSVELEDSPQHYSIPVVFGRHSVTFRVDEAPVGEPLKFHTAELVPLSDSFPGVRRHYVGMWSQQTNSVTFKAIPAGEYRLSMVTSTRPLKWVDAVVTVG